MATGDPCCGLCGATLEDGGPLCKSCRRQRAEKAAGWTRTFGGVWPCRPPQASEPPFQQCAVRICRVCGLEYPETPCLQTHVCHACRLPALVAMKCAKCRWEFAPREHPCLSCKHWLPSGPAAELGAGMCTRRDVPCHDFSCFRAKEG